MTEVPGTTLELTETERGPTEVLPTTLDRRIVPSAIVQLLRRHSINNRLCCDNNEEDLERAGTDSFGFVTKVKCKKCQQIMETTCHDAKWAYEIIKESELNSGDHICWHRPYAIWHHAIVTAVGQEIKVIHYSDLKVQESTMAEAKCCSWCNTLYRVNYEDCYDADYTVERARKLKEESRYNLLERNCEHFSRWCKTGSTSSSQVGIFWASLGKVALTICLRVIALVILGLLAYSHEAAEENVKDRQQLETKEKKLTIVYVVITSAMFMIYLLITSGSRLHPVRMKSDDVEDPTWCLKKYGDCTRSGFGCKRCCCCLLCFGLRILCQAACICCLALRFVWRRVECNENNPSTCCRRPYKLACGLFFRILVREGAAATGILCTLLHEEQITNSTDIANMSAGGRAFVLMLCALAANIGGYVVGALCGRVFEWCCCECCLE